MAKIILILVVALIIEAVGVVYLSEGLEDVRGVRQISAAEIFRVVKSGATNGKILAGVALEAVFFAALLYLLSVRDVSFVWPMTSVGFIITTLAAQFVKHESVPVLRWAGVLLIALGALVISYTEAAKDRAAAPPPADSASLHSQ